MENKIPFVFHWMPQYQKVDSTQAGRFIISPRFNTVCKGMSYRWCILMYPRGVPVTQMAKMMLDDDLFTNCSFCLVLQPWYTNKTSIKIVGDVEFEIKLKADRQPHITRLNNVIFRPRDLQAAKSGAMDSLKGLCDQGAALNVLKNDILYIVDKRILVTCRVFIPAACFEPKAFRVPHADDVIVDLMPDYEAEIGMGPIIDEEVSDGGMCVEEEFDSVQLGPVSIADFNKLSQEINESPDVVIVANDGVEFKCHFSKLQQNEFFARMFDPTFGFQESKDRRAVFHDVDSRTLNEFLFFLYTGELSTHCKEVVDDLLYLSEKYMVKRLKSFCCAVLLQSLEVGCVLKRYKMAQVFKLPELKEACLNLMANQPNTAFSDQAMNELTKDTALMGQLFKDLAQRTVNSIGITCIY